ncbi:MAG: hypothetical protein RJB66_1960 [Pseudomonadota bacterium]
MSPLVANSEGSHDSNHKNSAPPTGAHATSSPSGAHQGAQPSSSTTASGASTIEMKEKMILWSRQLGVTCVHCHNLENFKDDHKLSFKTALKHEKMGKVLQEEVFNDRDAGHELKVKVQCYMCHRGLQWPEYIEPPNSLTK